MPWVVTAGVPMRSPLVMYGGRGSSGTVFSLRLMPARSSARRAFLPDRSASKLRRSTSIRWLSVPPETRRRPWPASAAASAAALAHDLRGVVGELGRGRLAEGHGLGGDDVVERAALRGRGTPPCRWPRRARPCRGCSRRAGPRRVLWVVNVTMSAYGHRVGVHAAGDEPGDVGGVEHEQRTDLVGDVAERLRVDDAGVGGGAGDDHLGAVARGRGRAPGRSRSARRSASRRRTRSGRGLPLALTGEPWVRWPPWSRRRPSTVSPGSSRPR